MDRLAATGPNAEQITYWNEVSAPKWIGFQSVLDALLRPLGDLTIARLAPEAGERILDVGCGCGESTLELARRVAPNGSVTAVDISTPMLERARARALSAGLANCEFWNADAQTHAFAPASLDAVYSRFGVMFFADPARAFANLSGALRDGGRVAFVCWQSLEQNPWMAVPMAAARSVIPFPPRPAPEAPGPFSFADAERVKRILGEAGLAEIIVEEHERALTFGDGDLDSGVDFLVQMGPTATALREADPSAAPRVMAAVKESVRPFHTPAGLRIPSASWIVRAWRPS